MMTSSLSLTLALLGGFLTVCSPCVLPVLPIIVGRSLQSHRYGPVALVFGLVGGFALAGSLLGVSASWFGHEALAQRTNQNRAGWRVLARHTAGASLDALCWASAGQYSGASSG